MAYTTGKTSALQTAVKAATDIVAAELGAGLLKTQAKVDARFAAVRDEQFAIISAQVDADNELFAKNDSGSKSGGRRSGGNRKSGGGDISLEDARDMVLKFGAFKDVTLGEVYDMSASDAADYGYTDSDGNGKPGRQWVEWLAKNTDPKSDFSSKRAKVIVEAARAASDAA